MVDALYAALDCPEQCHHLLLGTQRVPELYLTKPNHIAINTAIQAFDRDNGQQLTAQLTSIACLARLCELELDHAPHWSPQGSSDPTPWYDMARAQGTFEYAIGSFMRAFKVSFLPLGTVTPYA